MQSLGNCQAAASVIRGPVRLKSTVLNIEFFLIGKFHSSAAGHREGRLLDIDARTVNSAHIGAMRLVAIDRFWASRNTFGDEHVGKAPEIGKSFGNFMVAEMLQHLANQAQACCRQRVNGDIGAKKADERVAHRISMVFNQFRNHVDADIAHAGCFHDPSSDGKVAAAQIGDALHLMIPDELNYGVTVLFAGPAARSGAGVESFAVIPPGFGAIDPAECLGKRKIAINAMFPAQAPKAQIGRSNCVADHSGPRPPFSIRAGRGCRRPRSVAASGIRSRNSVPRSTLDCTATLP